MLTIKYKHLVYALVTLIFIFMSYSIYDLNDDLSKYKTITSLIRGEDVSKIEKLEYDLTVLTHSFKQFISITKNYSNSVSENKKEDSNLDISHIEREISKSKVVIIKSEKANLRAYPNEKSEVVTSVTKGTELLVTKEDNGWSQVLTPTGTMAWISNKVLNDKENFIS